MPQVMSAWPDIAHRGQCVVKIIPLVINLVTNAIEAVVQGNGAERLVVVELEQDNGHAVLFVKDNGPGIPYINISKLFEPFFTTKKMGKGVGVGLSVAYGIIQEHGGSIFVRSTVGNGAAFEIRLPLKPASRGKDIKSKHT